MGLKEEIQQARADAVALAVRARDVKGIDAVVIDVSGVTVLYHFVVLVTTTSRRHAASLADALLETARDRKLFKIGVEGYEEGSWVLLDLTDVIVHLFLPELREYYGLEDLLADMPRVPLPAE